MKVTMYISFPLFKFQSVLSMVLVVSLVVLKYMLIQHGVRFVMITGESMMPEWSADSLDSAMLQLIVQELILVKELETFGWMMLAA